MEDPRPKGQEGSQSNQEGQGGHRTRHGRTWCQGGERCALEAWQFTSMGVLKRGRLPARPESCFVGRLPGGSPRALHEYGPGVQRFKRSKRSPEGASGPFGPPDLRGAYAECRCQRKDVRPGPGLVRCCHGQPRRVPFGRQLRVWLPNPPPIGLAQKNRTAQTNSAYGCDWFRWHHLPQWQEVPNRRYAMRCQALPRGRISEGMLPMAVLAMNGVATLTAMNGLLVTLYRSVFQADVYPAVSNGSAVEDRHGGKFGFR